MSKTSLIKAVLSTTALLMLACPAQAAEVEVKMLNKGSDGGMMVFEPAFVKIAPGDSVHFVATDKGHNIESNKGMIPDGAQPFTGKMNQDLTVKFDKPGVYGYNCKPHYSMGMVGLVVAGDPVNEDAAKALVGQAGMPNLAKNHFAKLFETLDAQKTGK